MPPNSDDSSEGENENGPPKQREQWFAGGERSGISVENPDAPRNRRNRENAVPGGDMVRELLRRAAECVLLFLVLILM